jgi:branched-chain amino acid transport system substrate-binding protein
VAARAAGVPADLTWVSSLAPVDCRGELADFCAGYTALAGHPPDSHAILAYDATNVLLDAIAQAASSSSLQRQAVTAALANVQRVGLNGTLAFDATRSWAAAPVFLYRRMEERTVR